MDVLSSVKSATALECNANVSHVKIKKIHMLSRVESQPNLGNAYLNGGKEVNVGGSRVG